MDDTESNRELIREELTAAGYSVEVAPSGPAALEMFARVAPDLVLLDIVMRGMDGFETLAGMRVLPEARWVPIVLMTVGDDPAMHEAAVAAGCEDFLLQPIKRTELLIRVRSLLAQRRLRVRLERLQGQRAVLLALLVHDLRSPLSSITMGAAMAARDAGASEATRRILGRIGAAAEVMSTMLMDMLDVGAAEERPLSITPRQVDVAVVCQTVAALIGPRVESNGQRLSVLLRPESSIIVRTDAELVRRTVTNLVENAVSYSPKGSVIELQATLDETATVVLCVRDQGPGVPPELREKIFEKYARVEGTVAPTSSRGLGLAFCRLATEALGGRIWVEDNVPQGAAFHVRLPSLPV